MKMSHLSILFVAGQCLQKECKAGELDEVAELGMHGPYIPIFDFMIVLTNISSDSLVCIEVQRA
jgi:hypothetical protein